MKYAASQAIASSDFIDILFPLNLLKSDTTYSALNVADLGTGILNG